MINASIIPNLVSFEDRCIKRKLLIYIYVEEISWSNDLMIFGEIIFPYASDEL